MHEQSIRIDETGPVWRRIRLVLEQPSESGDNELSFWSNLPPEITAAQIASLYRCRWRIEEAHREQTPELDVSTYHLAVHVSSDYQGMLIAWPAQVWESELTPAHIVQYLLRLAKRVSPLQCGHR